MKVLIRFYQKYLSKYTKECPRKDGTNCSQLALDIGLMAALPTIMTCSCPYYDD